MSGLTFWSIGLILFLSLLDWSKAEQCQNTRSNGYYGFCTSSNCCRGSTVSNLCPQGICCYGTNSCQSQSSSSQSNSCLTNSRQSWKALNPRNALKDLAPVSHLIIHHTNDGDSCDNFESCSLRLRSLQSYHQLTKKWDDIAWNFLIGGDGKVYEGIGWKKQGFHTLNWNNQSLGIAFIGNFQDQNDQTERILDSMLGALDNLIDCGRSIGQIKSDFRMHGHRDIRGMTTKCPGDYLYNQLYDQFNSFQSGPI